MKIAFTLFSYPPDRGGLENHARMLATQLRQHGHEVVIATRFASESPRKKGYLPFNEPIEELERDGLRIHCIQTPGWFRPIFPLIASLCFRTRSPRLEHLLCGRALLPGFIRALRGCDLISHAGNSMGGFGLGVLSAARRLGVPLVVQPAIHPGQHGDSPHDHYFYQRATRLQVFTEFEAAHLRRRGNTRPMDVVGTGIDELVPSDGAAFRQKHGLTGPIVLFLGRKTKDKGYALVREAFRLVRARHPEAALVTIGPDDPEGRLRYASEPGVVELGFVPEQVKLDALDACTLLCVPAEGESFGLSCMEAALRGKPVIARDLPALRELLGRHGAAYLVGEVNDASHRVALDAANLAKAIVRLLENRELRTSLSENGRRVAAQFKWSSVVGRVVQSFSAAT